MACVRVCHAYCFSKFPEMILLSNKGKIRLIYGVKIRKQKNLIECGLWEAYLRELSQTFLGTTL